MKVNEIKCDLDNSIENSDKIASSLTKEYKNLKFSFIFNAKNESALKIDNGHFSEVITTNTASELGKWLLEMTKIEVEIKE